MAYAHHSTDAQYGPALKYTYVDTLNQVALLKDPLTNDREIRDEGCRAITQNLHEIVTHL